MIAPQSDVRLLKVPLEISDLNQLTFANTTAQYNYFNSVPKIAFDEFTYQRQDDIIKIPALIDDIINYNYVMYRNDAYSNKWFYAFIENMEYKNDSVTYVKIKTDVWQTWQFDLRFKPTFIAREHTNDDTIGSNTQPETLETGEPIVNGEVLAMSAGLTGYYITFMVSDVGPLNKTWSDVSHQYNGIYSGYCLFGVNSLSDANAMVNRYIDSHVIESIKNIFLVPKSLYATTTSTIIDTVTPSVTIYFPQQITTPVNIVSNQTIARSTTLDGYTPKNNKLYTSQFSYLLVSNNVGGNAEYYYEDFKDATPKFSLNGVISSGCDIKLTPTYYKNVSTSNQIYGLKMGKLPVCSWNTDSYAIWMAQNQLNMKVSLTRNLAKVGFGTAVGAVTGDFSTAGSGVGSYLGDVLNSMSERYLAKHVPDEVHGDVNSSDYNYSDNLFFEFRRMSVRAEYAISIDNYFSALGYATNKIKLPNITGRRNWNYVKTIGCYIEGDIPQNDLSEIKLMFDKGITLWHNPSTFADYSQNNDII